MIAQLGDGGIIGAAATIVVGMAGLHFSMVRGQTADRRRQLAALEEAVAQFREMVQIEKEVHAELNVRVDGLGTKVDALIGAVADLTKGTNEVQRAVAVILALDQERSPARPRAPDDG